MTTTESGKVPTTSPTVQNLTPRSRIKVLWASLIGTSLESYDFYVFSYLSVLFLGPLFFEPLGAFGGTLAALLTNALGFVARPLGAIVFGHLGDRIGRRTTLILTITIMGVATGLIGVLPTYATAGWIGAVLLVTLRLIQGFSLGGEWGGGVLLATEYAGPKRHAFYAAFPQLGSPVGSIITALLYLLALPLYGLANSGHDFAFPTDELLRQGASAVFGNLVYVLVGAAFAMITASMAGGMTAALVFIFVLDSIMSLIPKVGDYTFGLALADVNEAIAGGAMEGAEGAGHSGGVALLVVAGWVAFLLALGAQRLIQSDVK